MKGWYYLVGMAAMLVYIANPGAGVFELIPDNIPGVGNLDEATAAILMVTWFRKWRALRALPPAENEAQPALDEPSDDSPSS